MSDQPVAAKFWNSGKSSRPRTEQRKVYTVSLSFSKNQNLLV